MRNPFENPETFIIRSTMHKETIEYRNKYESKYLLPEYVKIQQKKSDLSRSKRDEIVWKFEYYKNKGLYSETDLQKINQLITGEDLHPLK